MFSDGYLEYIGVKKVICQEEQEGQKIRESTVADLYTKNETKPIINLKMEFNSFVSVNLRN